MGAYYDSYNYLSYWQGREYEHESEVVAIRQFLGRIPKIDKALEIGGGYGRLLPYYVFRTKNTILTEPSSKLLSLAKKRLIELKNVKFIQSRIETLDSKIRARSMDLIVMIRVMHHIEKPDYAFETIEKLLAPNGYLILEFANKIHLKKVISQIFKANFRFIFNEETIDVRSKSSKRKRTIVFLNYHPNVIKKELEKHNFEILEIRSVSNIRSPFLKKYLPLSTLLELEKFLQKILSPIYFGPSIFVLARKRG